MCDFEGSIEEFFGVQINIHQKQSTVRTNRFRKRDLGK